MCGDFIALAGNQRALELGQRFVDRDLNRAWTEERLERLLSGDPGDFLAEDHEQVELLNAIEEARRAARGSVYLLDLHTTSGEGGPFTTFGDTLANREFASTIPVPMILGLEELVDGTLLSYFGERGWVAVVFESGQHDEPTARDRAAAAIWVFVAAAGLVPHADMPQAAEGWKLLNGETRRLPRVLEMRYRHPVDMVDGFTMSPGYLNFQKVEEGEVVARDVRGVVRVPEASRILMPLYQVQGEDGFFLVREFRPFWLWMSGALRTLRVDRVAHLLPGVARDPNDPHAVVVDRRVARWYALQLFHLLGFRKLEDEGGLLVLRRRALEGGREA